MSDRCGIVCACGSEGNCLAHLRAVNHALRGELAEAEKWAETAVPFSVLQSEKDRLYGELYDMRRDLSTTRRAMEVMREALETVGRTQESRGIDGLPFTACLECGWPCSPRECTKYGGGCSGAAARRALAAADLLLKEGK